jgi:NADPH:quinone reductase-like Zn-dependent oxidoreductase
MTTRTAETSPPIYARAAWLRVPQVIETSNSGKFAQTHNAWYRETLTELFDLLAAGRVKPVVTERTPLVEAARAHERLERGGHAGKVVLVASA